MLIVAWAVRLGDSDTPLPIDWIDLGFRLAQPYWVRDCDGCAAALVSRWRSMIFTRPTDRKSFILKTSLEFGSWKSLAPYRAAG